MPEPAKPKAKVGAGLKRKLGPLPLWAWLLIAGGAAGALYLYLRGSGGGGEEGSPLELVSGTRAGTPLEQASGGYPAGNAALTGQLDPSIMAALEKQQAAIGDLYGRVQDAERAMESSMASSALAQEQGAGGGYGRIAQTLESFGGVQAAPLAGGATAASAPKPKAYKANAAPTTKAKPKPKHTPPRKPGRGPVRGGKPAKPAPKPKRKPAPKGRGPRKPAARRGGR